MDARISPTMQVRSIRHNKIIQYYETGFKTRAFPVIPAVFHAKLFAHSVIAGLSHFKWPMCYDYLCSCRTLLSLLSPRGQCICYINEYIRVFLSRGNFVQHVTESLIIISNIYAVLVIRRLVIHIKYRIVNILWIMCK